MKKYDTLRGNKIKSYIESLWPEMNSFQIQDLANVFIKDKLFMTFCDFSVVQILTDYVKGSRDYVAVREYLGVEGKASFFRVYINIIQTLVFGIGEMVEMTGKSMSNNRRKSRRPTLRMFEGKIGSERQIEMIPSEPFDLGQEIIKKKIEEFQSYLGSKEDSISTDIQVKQEPKLDELGSYKPNNSKLTQQKKAKTTHEKHSEVSHHIENISIFNHLNSRHRINKKSQNNEKQKIQTLINNMKIDENDSPMLANDAFKSGKKSLSSIKQLPELLKTPSLPKLKNASTEFVTPNLSNWIYNQNDFYKKDWGQQISQPPTEKKQESSTSIDLKKQSEMNIRQVYGKNAMFKTLIHFKKKNQRRSFEEQMIDSLSPNLSSDKNDFLGEIERIQRFASQSNH